ncbi:MAG TPA: DUF1287 domain-containing protein [Holophagaceae bacterium]|nr:DUF1287 domain-containing protein [Holophagaceae bacterium]
MLMGTGPARLSALLTLGIPLLIAQDPGLRLVAAARAQVGVTLGYDSRYARIPYPGGDVPLDRGVCTDVLIRAYRAQGLDLQKLVHEDMGRAWEAYPRAWGLKAPDRNIDHRRVPNLATFFGRHGLSLPLSREAKAYLPGDIVTWRLTSGVPHTGLVSDRRSPAGHPLILHNIGEGVREEDRLFAYTLTGHYRYPAPAPRSQAQAAPRASRAE